MIVKMLVVRDLGSIDNLIGCFKRFKVLILKGIKVETILNKIFI